MNPIRVPQLPSLAASLVVATSLALPAQATENGVDNIGPGTDGFFVLPLDVNSLPDHMFAFNLYYNHYESKQLDISSLGGKVPEVKITSDAIIPRLDYLSPLRLLGGRVGGYVAQPTCASRWRCSAKRAAAKPRATPPSRR